MEPGEAREGLHRPQPVTERTRFCPGDENLAAWYEATLDAPSCDALQRHFADCDFCQARLGLLARLDEPAPTDEVPEELLAAAKQSAGNATRRTFPRAPTWAAAAVLVLAVSVVPFLGERPATTSPVSPVTSPTGDDGARQLRSAAPATTAPALLWPTEAARVAPGGLLVRWSAVPDALFYDVEVMSDAGDLLVDERVTATEWVADKRTLAPGADYFVRVEASLPDTRRLATDYVMFHVEAVD